MTNAAVYETAAFMQMEPDHVTKILFVCSRNKIRSYTAEKLCEAFGQYRVRSRGTENGARIKITEGDIGWADIIFTMEKRHSIRLRAKFKDAIAGKRLITLFIEDIYQPMEPALIVELRTKLGEHIDVPS